MSRKSGVLIGALAALFLAWSPDTASADSSRHGYKNDHRERYYDDDDDDRRRHKYKHRRDERHGYKRHDRHHRSERHHHSKQRHKSVYDDGRCRYTYKSGPRGTKETVRCRGDRGRGHGHERRHHSSHSRGDDLTVVLTQTLVALLNNAGYASTLR